MDGRDFLTLARALSKDTVEAAWRTAVSRAYYAAFHVARDLLEDLGFRVPHGDRAHGYLWMRLANSGDPKVNDAGTELNDLRRMRNRADYDLWLSFHQVYSQGQLLISERIIQILDTATADPLRTQITDAMKLYERNVLKDVTWRP